MPQFYVQHEVRRIHAIGEWSLKSDTVFAEDTMDAINKFRQKYAEVYDFRFPSQCREVEFEPTHRYLNIQTGEWEKVKMERNVDTCNAYVFKADGSRWLVGRPFLEKI